MDWVAILTLLATIGAGYCAVSFPNHKANLADPSARQVYINRLTHPTYEATYRAALTRGLLAVDWAFGSKHLFSPAGYVLCIAISFIYTITGFILAWALGGPGGIGEVTLLPETWSIKVRLVYAIV